MKSLVKEDWGGGGSEQVCSEKCGQDVNLRYSADVSVVRSVLTVRIVSHL